MIKPTKRPNGNLTLREYDANGRVINKIIQKGTKDIVSSFNNQGKLIMAAVYDNKDTVTINNTKGEFVAEFGKVVTRLLPDKKMNFIDKIALEINKKAKEDFRVLTKEDGVQYVRAKKQFAFSPQQKFSHKLINFMMSIKTLKIRAAYTHLLAGRKCF